tara:strand:+ start:466 stop:648 length:183 start_codon:yes stop_codon:yes gene_type:complete
MKTIEQKLDKNGMPEGTIYVKAGPALKVYYYIDDDGKKVYDEELMREEFEAKIEFLKQST